MANDWIKWVKGLEKRREVIGMAVSMRSNCQSLAAMALMDVCKLIAADWMVIWSWADSETTDGHVQGITREYFDTLAGRPGFASAAEEQKWVRFAGGITFLNWGTHNGESAKVRARNSANQTLSRNRNGAKKPVTEMSPANGDKTVTREEKRRVDKKEVYKSPSDGPTGFAHWWSTYPNSPRKADWRKCLEKWEKLGLEADCVRVLEALRTCIKSRDWTKNDGDFIPAPLVWLNKAPWESLTDLREQDPNDQFRLADDDPMFAEVTARLNAQAINQGNNGNF